MNQQTLGAVSAEHETLRDPDSLLQRANQFGNPDRDQHFLIDERVVNRIPGYLPATVDLSHILEIGGGTGILTDRLLTVADTVTVIEQDSELVSFLQAEFETEISAGRLDIIDDDALTVSLPDFTACVSNLPYSISTPITFRLLPEQRPLILMYQAEVGERLAADPDTDSYGRLSVGAQHFADVEPVESVPSSAFSPPPAVESVVMRFVPQEPSYTVSDEERFFDFVKALFTQRRKTVRNAIRNTTHISNIERADEVLAEVDSSYLSKRPEKLTPGDFAYLTEIANSVSSDDS
jgi:16S rRNA (adenine1518-N6/adenine1519-N6)-dimethyltransferase